VTLSDRQLDDIEREASGCASAADPSRAKDDAYVASLRDRADREKASADHRLLVNASLVRRLRAYEDLAETPLPCLPAANLWNVEEAAIEAGRAGDVYIANETLAGMAREIRQWRAWWEKAKQACPSGGGEVMKIEVPEGIAEEEERKQ